MARHTRERDGGHDSEDDLSEDEMETQGKQNTGNKITSTRI